MILSLSIDDLLGEEVVGVYNNKNITPFIEIKANKKDLLRALAKVSTILNDKKSKILNEV